MAPLSTPRRKDAQRSRQAILAAAQQLLTERREASFAEIAHAAGVGQATVYRHFADRQELVATLLEETAGRIRETAAAEAGGADGFERLLRTVIAEQVRCQGLMSVVREGELDEERLEHLKEDLLDLFREPLARSIRAGLIRPDFELEEVILLLNLLDGAIAQIDELAERERVCERALEIILDGIAPR